VDAISRTTVRKERRQGRELGDRKKCNIVRTAVLYVRWNEEILQVVVYFVGERTIKRLDLAWRSRGSGSGTAAAAVRKKKKRETLT
jgi:hypothetical protein